MVGPRHTRVIGRGLYLSLVIFDVTGVLEGVSASQCFGKAELGSVAVASAEKVTTHPRLSHAQSPYTCRQQHHTHHHHAALTTPGTSPPNPSIVHARVAQPCLRPSAQRTQRTQQTQSQRMRFPWPADSDETNPALCSAGVLDSQAQCQPHVTRRRALRDYCARASESTPSRQREPTCRPRCTPPPRCLVHRLPARTQISG